MRRMYLIPVLAAVLGIVGIAGCSEVENALRDEVRSACDDAVSNAEDNAADGESARALSDELGSRIDDRYREFMNQVVDEIPAEAAERGIADGINKAVPAEQREEWHDMAVDVCTDEVMSRVDVG